MDEPSIKHEILISLCPNPRALEIHMATPRMVEWVDKQGRAFSSDSLFTMSLDQKATPCSTVLMVSPCFDVEEVKAYLVNPIFTEENTISIVKD